jgi:uracil-DNA glycosylase family 4
MPAQPPADPSRVDFDTLEQLRGLAAVARAHLEAELELGGIGLPRVAPANPPRAAASAPATSATGPRVGAQSTGLPSPAITPAATPVRLPIDEVTRRLQQVAQEAASCTACALHAQRTQSVFARGSLQAELVFVGEGPGAEEDRTGEPFVGPAGQLLDKMIVAMGYERDAVYICNIVKCRPPGNRTPQPEEALACKRFLHPQLELVAPRVIVALGRCAAEHLGVAGAEGPWRGRWGRYGDVPVMPTYHPAYLLRSPEHKRTVWEDLQLVMAKLGREPAARRR